MPDIIQKKYNRVLLKISGEMLSREGFSVDSASMDILRDEIYDAYKNQIQIGIVIGGGNFWRGRDTQDLGIFRGKSDQVGMLATVMNALAFSGYLEKGNISTAVFSSRRMEGVCEEFTFSKVERAFSENRICFFCGGTGNPYFTTDSACALRAIEISADIIGKATTVDGVYSDDPRKNDKAVRYDQISFDEVISKGLSVMDTAAFALCKENSIPILVFDGKTKGNIKKMLTGEKIGTFVS